MLNGMFDTVGLSNVLRKVTVGLNKRFGESEYYSLQQVDEVIKETGLNKQSQLPYLFAAHCEPSDFYNRFVHTEFNYSEVREVVAKKCFGHSISFSQNLLKAHAQNELQDLTEPLDRSSSGYAPYNGPSLSDGGSSGGGCDGGSC